MNRLRTAILLLVLVASATWSSCAFATGREVSATGSDLELVVNWKWAGCENGGYYPVRIEVKNNGPTRELTFQFGDRAEDELVPVVRRRVLCENEKTTNLTLMIPIVGKELNGTLFVTENGERVGGLDVPMQLPMYQGSHGSDGHPNRRLVGTLVISRVGVDPRQLRESMRAMSNDVDADVETVAPETLPLSWLAYTGLDLVIVEIDTFQNLSQPARTAIVRWVECGGNLILHGVEPDQWGDFSTALDRKTRLADTAIGAEGFSAVANLFKGDKLKVVEIMQGLVVGTSATPFDRSGWVDWSRLLTVIGPDRLKWSTRNGMIARDGGRQFTDFLIPGVKSVPVYQFLALITLFTLVIGPVNYLWLWKKRQLNLLLVTIPVLAFVTSVTLFAYSAVQHGFGVKSRIRSLTILDQGTQESVTQARVAMFAGMKPSLSLEFSPQTAVFPVWPAEQTYEQGDIDWTETQSLENGWLRSRTRTQFYVVNHSTQKGRLDVTTASDSTTSVSNGLEWQLQMLLVRNADGALMVANDVAIGSNAELRVAEAGDVSDFREILQLYPVEPPDEQKNSLPREILEMGRSRRDRRRWNQERQQANSQAFSTSIMEREISQLEQIRLDEPAVALNSYVAILEQNPGVDLGIKDTDEQASLHLLVGYFE